MAKSLKGLKLDRTRILNILKNCYLGGLIEECILKIKNGKGIIEAVDITSSIIVVTKKRILPKGINTILGIGNIDLLAKSISAMPDNIKAFLGDDYFSISNSGGRRKLIYLLTDPDLISTKIEMDDNEKILDKIRKSSKYTAELTESFIQDFQTNISLLKIKEVSLKAKGDALTFVCGGENDHQYKMRLENEIDCDENMEVKLNGENLSKVFSVISRDEDEPVTIQFGENSPLVINGKDSVWALTPLAGLEDEEGD